MSKTKVSILNTTYKIDFGKKTVVCILKCVYNVDINHCRDIFISDYDLCSKFPNTKRTSKGLEFTVVGVAKCHDDDHFNHELGQKIALAKAEIKMFNSASKFHDYIQYALALVMEEFNDCWDNCCKALRSEKEYLENLINQ